MASSTCLRYPSSTPVSMSSPCIPAAAGYAARLAQELKFCDSHVPFCGIAEASAAPGAGSHLMLACTYIVPVWQVHAASTV